MPFSLRYNFIGLQLLLQAASLSLSLSPILIYYHLSPEEFCCNNNFRYVILNPLVPMQKLIRKRSNSSVVNLWRVGLFILFHYIFRWLIACQHIYIYWMLSCLSSNRWFNYVRLIAVCWVSLAYCDRVIDIGKYQLLSKILSIWVSSSQVVHW